MMSPSILTPTKSISHKLTVVPMDAEIHVFQRKRQTPAAEVQKR